MAETIAVGAALGLTVASVPGPGWVLVIDRTVGRGWAAGIAGGAGIATVHGLYGAAAAYEMAAVTGVLLDERRWLALAGGAALVLLGLWRLAWRPSRPSGAAGDHSRDGRPDRGGLVATYTGMAAFTAGNPQAIITFLAGPLPASQRRVAPRRCVLPGGARRPGGCRWCSLWFLRSLGCCISRSGWVDEFRRRPGV
jgi:threonine/homoserine/homoserine lactone efflux protein